MAERCMPKVMPKCNRLRQIFIHPQGSCDRPRRLCYLKRVGQPGAVVISLRQQKNLCLMLQSAKCFRM